VCTLERAQFQPCFKAEGRVAAFRSVVSRQLCIQTGGHFFLASGNGVFLQMAGRAEPQIKTLPSYFQGTICVLAFVRAKISNYPELMHKAKQSLGLLPNGETFGSLFE